MLSSKGKTMLKPLFPHQQKALDLLRDSVRTRHKRPVINMPTAAGKTVLAAHVVVGARGKDNRVAFLVPAINLIDQTFNRFSENGIDPADMGIVQANHPWKRPSAPIQICSVQTIAKRGWPVVDIIVVDEAHLMHEATKKWMLAEPGKLFIGLTATPWAKGMADLWDDLIQPTSIRQLIDEGRLCNFKAFAPSHPDLSKVRTIAGDYHEGELADVMGEKKLVADIVQTWLMKAGGRKTLVFCVNRAHAGQIHDEFMAQGVRSEYVDAFTPRVERAEIIKRLEKGETQVICSIGTMTTGVDIPPVDCIQYARPTKSEILYVQSIGRGLRAHPGKDHLLILDHSDTTLRLGTVDQIRHDRLRDGKPGKSASDDEKKLPLPKECPSCGMLIPVKVKLCPNCGQAPKWSSAIETVDGELIELGVHSAAAKYDGWRYGKQPRDWTLADKSAFYSELRAYGRDHGYAEGWAAHQYRERLGAWPDHPSIRYAALLSPTRDTLSWLQSRQIAWAKRRGAERRVLGHAG
jgi:superfamily II DNA or RNA helicase